MTGYRTSLIFTAVVAVWMIVLAPHGPRRQEARAPLILPVSTTTLQATQVDSLPHQTPTAPTTPETDLTPAAFGWNRATLAALEPGERIDAPHPDGGTMTFEVEAVRHVGKYRLLRLRNDRLVSTVTVGDQDYFATLAAQNVVLSVNGHQQLAVSVPHTLVDQRWNVHAQDYRHAPI